MEELDLDQGSGENVPGITSSAPPGQEPPGETPVQIAPPAPSAPKRLTLMAVLSAIFNGAGIGLLLGMLLGLSVSPVVSGVVATLSSLLAVLIGLNEKYLDPLKSMRIGAFGLFAVFGIIWGLYIRAYDPFSPSLLDKKKEYMAIGYTDAEAKAMITGIIKADTGSARKEANVLYSSSVSLSECDNLRGIDESWTKEDLVNLESQEGYLTGTWYEFLDTFLKDLPNASVVKALIAVRNCFCPDEGGSGELQMSTPDVVKNLSAANNVDEMESAMMSAQAGKTWQIIVTEVRKEFPEQNDRKGVYLSIIKVLGHDENS